jgi:acyl carrier protein
MANRHRRRAAAGDDRSQDVPQFDARTIVIRLIRAIAPDVDADAIEHGRSLHDIADIDSLDFLRLMALTAEETGVTIPPRDYPLVVTLDGFARYVACHSRPPE